MTTPPETPERCKITWQTFLLVAGFVIAGELIAGFTLHVVGVRLATCERQLMDTRP